MTTTLPLDVTYLLPFSGEMAARSPAPSQAIIDRAVEGPTGTPQVSEDGRQFGSEHVEASMHKLNNTLQNFGIQFEFSDPGNHLIARVVDRETGDLIRQIPSEEMLRISQHIESLQGLLVDVKA